MLDRPLSDKHYPCTIYIYISIVHKLSYIQIWNLMKLMTGLTGFQCTRPSLKVSTDAIFVRDKHCFLARCLAPDLLITPFSCKYSQPTAPPRIQTYQQIDFFELKNARTCHAYLPTYIYIKKYIALQYQIHAIYIYVKIDKCIYIIKLQVCRRNPSRSSHPPTTI